MSIFTTYKKLDGTKNYGREYEQLTCALFALQLCQNENVKNFEMTSNNISCGLFDDIEIKLTFQDNSSPHRFCFQLKHKENNKPLTCQHLLPKSETGDFAVLKYFHSMSECNLHEDTTCILLTNTPTKITGRHKLTDDISVHETELWQPSSLFFNFQTNVNYFKVQNSKHHFYLITDYFDVKKSETQIQETVETFLNFDVYGQFVQFMTTWWAGKFVLFQHDVLCKITELALSPYIKPITEEKINERSKLVTEAIEQFDITITEKDLNIVENLWNYKDDDNFSKAQNKFKVSKYKPWVTLWYLEKEPLVIKVDKRKEADIKKLFKLLQKDKQNKKFVLIGNFSIKDFEGWKCLTDLSDIIKTDKKLSDEILKNTKISLQKKQSFPLEDFVRIDNKILELITVTDLLIMTQKDCLTIGKPPQTLKEFYIPQIVLNKKNQEIKEENILRCFNGHLNIICSAPGMGKTTLMKSLSLQTFPTCWSVYSKLILLNLFLAKKPTFGEILLHLLKTGEPDYTSKKEKILQFLTDNGHLCLFLDGFDELDREHLEIVSNFVQEAASKNIKVWISSRKNLHDVVSIWRQGVLLDIKEFDSKQQETYLYKRLKVKYNTDEIDKILQTFSYSASLNNSQNLLGVPLKLFILTETFLNDDKAYEKFNIQQNFTLTQIYKAYFKGRWQFYFSKITDNCLRNSDFIPSFKPYKKQYEVLGLKYCLNKWDFRKLQIDDEEIAKPLTNFKQKGDKFGIIVKVFGDNRYLFYHHTYAEYFACRWLTKNLDKIKLLGDSFFGKQYRNIRLMFDEILAKNKPLHLSILYKNFEQVSVNLPNFKDKDKGGRTPWHLVCTETPEYNSKFSSEQNEKECYQQIVDLLSSKRVIIFEKDDLFNFDSIDYLLAASCLYPLELLLEKNVISFSNINKRFAVKFEQISLTSAYNDYILIFKHLFKLDPIKVCETIDIHQLINDTGLGKVVTFLTRNLQKSTYEFKQNFIKVALEIKNFTLLDQILNHDVKDFDKNNVTSSFTNSNVVKTFELVKNTTNSNKPEDVLFLAAENNCVNLAKLFFSANKNFNLYNFNFKTLFNYNNVDNKNFSEVTKFLIKNLSNFDLEKSFEKIILFHSFVSSNLEYVGKLLDAGANLDILDDDGNSCLHFAAISTQDNSELIKLLVRKGCNLNFKNKDGATALHFACEFGHLRNVVTLLEFGVKYDLVDNYGNSCLHFAAKRKDDITGIINLFVKKGLDVDLRNNSGATALHYACEFSTLSNVIKFSELGASLNILDNNENSCLHFAARSKHANLELIKLLATKNIQIKNKFDVTPLHFACEFGILENIETFVALGANFDILDRNGNTCLHFAARSKNDNSELIKFLVGKCSDKNVKNKFGATAVHVCCEFGTLRTLERFLQLDLDFNLTDENDNTCLHFAARSKNDNFELIKLLVTKGLNMNIKNSFGATPLHFACQFGILKNVKSFLELGSNCDIVDNERDNCYHYAAKSINDKSDLIKLLAQQNLNPNLKNELGKSAIHYACENRNLKIFKTFLEIGIKCTVSDSLKNNCLHYAAKSKNNNSKLIKLLITKGLNPNSQNKFQVNPLHYACEYGILKNIEILLELGAGLDVLDRDENSCLHYATRTVKDNSELLKLLTSKGLDPNLKNKFGETPLHNACEYGNLKNFQTLKELGARFDVLDNDKNSCLHKAASSKNYNQDLIILLASLGLSPYVENIHGKTAFSYFDINCGLKDALIEFGAVEFLWTNTRKINDNGN